MAQIMSVRLARNDASPWGFRLQGGKDFGSPLQIQKVNGGSPAERAGLQAGDAVIKVNNTEVYNLRHKDAQDNIVRAGNSFEITVQRGGSTWKPTITPVGPSPVANKSPAGVTPVTKTSLAHNHPSPSPMGGGYNYSPAPFAAPQVNGNVPSIVNKQYNTPVGIYSEETIAETLSAQAEVLATGVLGVNFKKNEKNYDPSNSEVLKMLNEIANEPHTLEPEFAPPPASVAPLPVVAPYSTSRLRHVAAPELRPQQEGGGDVKTSLPPGQNICAECERLVVGVFVRIKDKNLHVECFKCSTCGSSLKNVGYYNISGKLYCDVHAKLVARQQPPAPNLEPVTVPFGGVKPAGAISAALAKSGVPSQLPSMGSPQPSTLGPMPFHAPGGMGAKPFSPAPMNHSAPAPPFSAPAPPFSAPAPAPFSAPAPAPFSAPAPAPFSAPAPAPFTNAAKPAPVGRFVWPPPGPADDPALLATATPLYIPPGPPIQSELYQQPPNQSVPSDQPSDTSLSVNQSRGVQPFPQPYADFASHQPVARPLSAYQYAPKSLHKSHVTFEDGTVATEAHKKFSVCSQEVQGFTDRRSLASSIEQISETIDTAIMVSALSGRPASPAPRSPVAHEDERQLVAALNEVIDSRSIEEVHQQSERIAEEFLQSEHSLSPVTYQQLENTLDGFTPIPQESEPHSALLPILVAQPEPSSLISALTTAPDRPYTPLPTPAAPLPIQPVPFPAETEVYRPAQDRCASPMLSALTIAPQRPYSPFPVVKAPISVLDSVEDMRANVSASTEPFNLPTPSHYSSMLAALTIAPDRAYSPLVVTQAPSLTTQAEPVPVQAPARTGPSKIVAVEPEVFRPVAAVEIPPEPVAIEAPPPSPELEVAPPPPPPEPVCRFQEPPKEPRNSLNLHRETQHRPITPKLPRPITPSSLAGLQKPAVIPYYQQNLGDGDFPCRSPRPATPGARPVTPALACPMTKPITPLPHKQLDIVRAETPGWVYEASANQSSSKQSSLANQNSCISQSSSVSQGQVVVTRKTRVTEEFESSHKESSQVFETQGTSRKLVSSSEVSDSLAAQSCAQSRETAVYQTKRKSSAPTVERKQSIVQMQAQLLQQSVPQVPERKQSISAVERRQSVAQSQEERKQSIPAVERRQSVTQSQEERKQSIPAVERRQSVALPQEERKQSITQLDRRQSIIQAAERKQSFGQIAEERKPSVAETLPQVPERRKSIPQVQLMAQMFNQPSKSLPLPRVSLAETQRASPLPFPNIDLPKGMTFEIVADKALYQSGAGKQVYKIPGPGAWNVAAPDFNPAPAPLRAPDLKPVPAPLRAPTPTFKAVAPSNMQPFIALMSPNFEPSVNGFQPVAPLPAPSASSFTPLVPQPHPVRAPSQPSQISFRPVAPQSSVQPSQISFRPVAPQSSVPPSQMSFRPCAPRPKTQPLAPQPQYPASAPRQPLGQTKFQPLAPQPTLPANPVVAPRALDFSVPPLTGSPPNAGGAGGVKGATFAGSSAPVRGRGIMNQAVVGRVALCGSCNGNIRGPFVTALGKIWCPEHFICVNPQCRRQLADIGFVEEKGQLYCEYCFEQFIAPPCAKCSGKIKGDCLNAVGKQYHPECFLCAYCGKLFGNNPFFLEDGLPYCQADWNELFTTKCFACGFPIEAGDRWVEALNNNYHSQCFNCTSCKKNLEGQSFFAKSGRPFCKAHAR